MIRDASPSDAEAVAAIYAPEVLHGFASFEEVPPDAEEMRRRMTSVAEKGLPWLVFNKDGTVAGYAYASPFRLRSAYRFTVENSVYVAEHARGRGVARLLMQELIGRCSSLGLKQMIAAVSGGNASIRLHAACGFREIGRYEQVGFKHGRWCDVVLMQRAL